MKRSRARINEWLQNLRPLALPALLSVTIFFLSSLGFVYSSRNEMLIFTAMRRYLVASQTLVAIGATATKPAEHFTDAALIEYLHALYEPDVRTEEVGLAEALLRAGASLTERSSTGWTPLMLAAGAGQSEIVQLFVRHGADIDARGIGDEQTEGITALMAASMHGHAHIVKFLIDRGSNLHLRSRAGYTALLLAASRGHLTCIEILLQKGAAVPLSTVQVAERNGHKEVAQRLREAMDSPRPDSSGRRPAKFPEE